MSIAKTGDKVAVHYTGKFADGIVFDSSEGRDTLQFQLGTGMVIKGFDEGITGMTIGDKKTVNIPAKDAYGEANPESIITIPKSEVPADMQVEIGMQLTMNDENGNMLDVTVTDLTEQSITLDANHPLAGKDLIFDIELVNIL
ncbi:MAG: peptidylprolyl isomerase [Pseudarcicella sp.]|nr:peptidylprolyl isomerase [Pseudarcicella sp.]MBP6410553.1 peptidylprolyl isomerase [Pseudarcicella sp.]